MIIQHVEPPPTTIEGMIEHGRTVAERRHEIEARLDRVLLAMKAAEAAGKVREHGRPPVPEI